ncbi:MAG: hypothetical protein AABY93_08570 [Bacteroidota bacterium]
MRTFNKATLLCACFAIAVLSCTTNSDPVPEPTIDDLSQFARNFVGMRLSSPNAMNRASETTVNKSFQNMMSTHGFGGGRVKDSTSTEGPDGSDSTIYPEPWISCAVITQIENPDGSTTVIYDYGDGCEEGWGDYKYFMHGKSVQTYKYSSQQTGSVVSDSYLFKMLFDNYGGYYYGDSASVWNMDGNSSYEGYSSYDTAENKFSGAYSYNDTSLYAYGEKHYNYKSKGKSHYDEKGWVMEVNDYEYGDGSDYYRSHLITPLVTDYSCNEPDSNKRYVWVAVSGHEVVTYKQGDKEGSFEVEYGNGECDNIIYITEDGKRVAVDLGEQWFVLNKEG